MPLGKAPLTYHNVLGGKTKAEHVAELEAAQAAMIAKRPERERQRRRLDLLTQMRDAEKQAFCA
jgi:hypothetical protein